MYKALAYVCECAPRVRVYVRMSMYVLTYVRACVWMCLYVCVCVYVFGKF